MTKYTENSAKLYIQKCRDVQLKRSFPRSVPFVTLLSGVLMEINSGSLRKLLDSCTIDQEISRTADRYSWRGIVFLPDVSKSR